MRLVDSVDLTWTLHRFALCLSVTRFMRSCRGRSLSSCRGFSVISSAASRSSTPHHKLCSGAHRQFYTPTPVGGGHELVADEDEGYVRGGKEGEDVGLDPGGGANRGGEGGDGAVGGGDGDGDPGAGEGADEVGVAVEELDAVDEGAGLEEGGDLGCGWVVVGEGVIVDADGDSGGGGGGDGGEGDEEEREEFGGLLWE